nr:immunoglobulin light chain junction region [Macaca mulatta]MOY09878.1 immunoglobulin light chain junction region [Macaca mulatta]MOY10197.1 immunoglobulin light chain junction region [Macaca mulatta]
DYYSNSYAGSSTDLF